MISPEPKAKTTPFPVLKNEELRVQALRNYRILDTDPEQLFDDLVEVAAMFTDVPIALISLVDSERQWFKARHGLDIAETPREHALCNHTICGKSCLVVKDTASDARFRSNPLVIREGGIRFYAGAPMINRDGLSIGSLCVIDTKPRTISREQVVALEALARTAMTHIELSHVADELAEVSSDLKEARSLIPICCHCKSIRNDSNYWESVETYIGEHSTSDLTHGICPDCMETHHSVPESPPKVEEEKVQGDSARRKL